jgi:hypothetical protein
LKNARTEEEMVTLATSLSMTNNPVTASNPVWTGHPELIAESLIALWYIPTS